MTTPDETSGAGLGSRIIIVGFRGAGKTTLAMEVSSLRGYERISHDAVLLDADRRPRESDQVEADLERLLPEDQWILDGHVGYMPEFVWRRSTSVIWLDYSRGVLLARQIQRARSNKGILPRLIGAGGKYARPKEMLLRGRRTWQTHAKNQARDDTILQRLEAEGCNVIRIESDKDRRSLIESLALR